MFEELGHNFHLLARQIKGGALNTETGSVLQII